MLFTVINRIDYTHNIDVFCLDKLKIPKAFEMSLNFVLCDYFKTEILNYFVKLSEVFKCN